MFLHRNSQKRIYLNNAVYFITTNTYKGYEYFKEPLFCDFFIETLEYYRKINYFKLYAFCILFNHVHLLLKPCRRTNISQIMFSLKKQYAHNINRIISPEGGQALVRLRGDNKLDYLVSEIRGIITKKFKKPWEHYLKFKWQESFHDHYIRNERDFQNHLRYTAYNHLKHGLPEDWQYTSLNYGKMIDNI